MDARHRGSPAHGALVPADTEPIAAYRSAAATVAEAERALQAESKVYVDKNRVRRRNPWLIAHRAATDTLARFAGQLGLTPAARVGLPATRPESTAADWLLS